MAFYLKFALLFGIGSFLTNPLFASEVKTGPGIIKKYIVVPGKITTNPNNTAHLSPRYEGVVKNVYVSAGQEVKKGDKLAQIERNVGVSTYNLISPISGTVLYREINPGDPVKEDQQAFKISNLTSVWVNFEVRPANIDLFSTGKNVSIRSRDDAEEYLGSIFYVSPTVNISTRTIRVSAEIANKNRLWLPGKIVDGYLIKNSRNVSQMIPLAVLHEEAGKNYVFAKSGHDFVKTYIKIGEKDELNAEIVSGLSAGSIVTASAPDQGHDDHDDHGENEGKGDGEDHHEDDDSDDHDKGEHKH